MIVTSIVMVTDTVTSLPDDTDFSLSPPEHMLCEVTIRVEIFTNKLSRGRKLFTKFPPEVHLFDTTLD